MHSPTSSPSAAVSLRPGRQGVTVLAFSGRLDADGAAALWNRAVALCPASGGLLVDASKVDFLNVSGMALLIELRRRTEDAGERFELTGLNERFAKLFGRFSPQDLLPGGPPDAHHNLAEEVGRKACVLADDIVDMVAFVGEFAAALAWAVAAPGRVRWRDALHVAETAGVNAFPIIVLIGFLMGLIMAFQSAMPLRQFGAEIFVGNLLGLSLLRELGPLVTAIILAGRSGSAFAAEIGTMTVNEEIHALRTMGLDPVRFLVVTRVLAAMAMTPMLVLFFNLAGLLGGALVMLSLGYPLVSFLNQVQGAVSLGDMMGGLFKAVVFSLLVCAVGCQRGLRTRGGASAVGDSTTSAVVAGIILIALCDGVFAVTFYALGW